MLVSIVVSDVVSFFLQEITPVATTARTLQRIIPFRIIMIPFLENFFSNLENLVPKMN